MKKIGIVTRTEALEGIERTFVNDSYGNAIRKEGWFPVFCNEIALANWYAQNLDALLIPGGLDIDPLYYQKQCDPATKRYPNPIDALDFALLEAFLQEGKPILGICRGLQVINVFFRGTLKQDINTDDHERDHLHEVTILPGSFLSSMQKPVMEVNSYHHQTIDRLGKDLRAIAVHRDQTIEAIIHKTFSILAVQWHPERMEDDVIIPYFLHACATCRFPLHQRHKK